MTIIKPSVELMHPIPDNVLQHIELCGRVCYKSEDKITEDSAGRFVKGLIARGHESVLEHYSVSVRMICDRGVSHELVRHRIAGFAQESTRYCNYSGEKFGRELTFIKPSWATDSPVWDKYNHWLSMMKVAEDGYMAMLDLGATPQEARAVLPNSLATKIAITANLREWIHIFKLRCDHPAHPDMRHVMTPILKEMLDRYPHVFQPVYNWLVNKGAVK
jgi:thymidylate synthase (FAD)